MGLPHGTDTAFDIQFANDNACSITVMNGTIVFNFPDIGQMKLNPVVGDCTAATIYSNYVEPNEFYKTILPVVLKYASASGRITVFFSRKCCANKESIKQEVDYLKKYNVVGLNVQQANRSNYPNHVMLSGLIKITNPFVKGRYSTIGLHDKNILNGHDSFARDDFDSLNKELL